MKRGLELATIFSIVILTAGCCATSKGPHGNHYGGSTHAMTEFPPPGVDVIQHELRIEVLRISAGPEGKLPGECESAEAVGARAEHLEDLAFTGRMIIRRGETRVNQEGLREQPFLVKAWSANAYSSALDTVVQYVLSPDTEQPESAITAEQKGRDFPASLTFNVVFDAYANGRLVRRQHHGRPAGHNFLVIPPNGDRRLSPTIREFENCFVDVRDPQDTNVLLRFRPRDCNDQNSQTLRTTGAG